jgi:hypothetical protein
MKESVSPASSTYRVISETYTFKQQILSRTFKASLFKAIERVAPGATFSILFSIFALAIVVHSAIAQEVAPPATTGIANNRVAVANSTHPSTRTAADLGRVAPDMVMEKMIMVLASDAGQEQSLTDLLDRLHTKGSPRYHQWLTPEDFKAQFGPSAEAIAKVTTWLEGQGFKIDGIARSGRWVQFSGRASQVEGAFQTELHRYQLNGANHIANASDLSLPAEVAQLVHGVLPLHDFSFKRPLLGRYFEVTRNSQGKLVPKDPAFTIANPGVTHFLAPGDYAKIYDLNSLYQGGANGSGQTIAIVARSKVELTDVETFRSIFGLPASDPTMIVNGADPGFTFSGDSLEASLDVEWAGAVAPSASIDLVVSASTLTTDGVDLSSAYIVDNNLAPIMTVSFGECEKFLGAAENAFYNSLWQQASAQGISVFVSAGDNGAAGCDNPNSGPATLGLAVSGLASTPFNTAVGGTQFNENGNDSTFWNSTNDAAFSSVVGYIPETVWNESCDPTKTTCLFNEPNLFAGSGGASSVYAKPLWQAGVAGIPNDGNRDIPDVSFTSAAAHDGFLLCFEGSCQTTTDSNGHLQLLNASVVGGTSAASPSFAGLMAIVDQQAGGRQGLANYVLYPLAAAENFSNCNASNRTNPASSTSCVFNDVTAGNNSVPGLTGFSAGTGYDLATGLGSVNAANLVPAFVAFVKGLLGTSTTLAANGSTSVQHGQLVSFTVNVSPSSGSAVPTGNVSLVTSLQGQAGPGSFIAVGAGALSNGIFTGSFADLPGGQYSVSAHYPGDSSFVASDSNAVTVNISKENSVTTLSNIRSFPFGEQFPFHAFVTGVSGQSQASGTMTFSEGNTQLGSVPLNNAGQADFLPTGPLTLGVGTHTIGASYSGDNSFNASTAQPITFTVTKGFAFLLVETFTTFTGTGSAAVFVFGSGPILPTGTVQLSEAGVALGNPVPLVTVNGDATANFSGFNLSAGVHNFGLAYSGDSVYQSAAFNFQIFVSSPFAFDPAPNSSLSQTVKSGQTATYNLLLSSEGITGNVALTCSGAPAGSTCKVNPASAVLANGSSVVPITVTVTTTAVARNQRLPFRTIPFAVAGVIAALSFATSKRRRSLFLMLFAFGLIAAVSACGGKSTNTTTVVQGPTSAILTLTGNSNGSTSAVQLQLTINP